LRAALLVGLALAGCNSRTADGGDGPAPLDASPNPDRAVPDLSRVVDTVRDTVAAPDQDGCYCKSGEVWLRGSCVPTMKTGTCGPGCDPSDPATCPTGQTCDQWAAAPCCMCAAAVPACVPDATTGAIGGPLRIMPTSGTAGQSVTITVEGAPFYVGALFYLIRMGSEEKMEKQSGHCTIKATFKPPTPGPYVVEVSQYGGGPPWVLAGFYTASGGSTPMPTIQPGFPCSANPAPGDPACAQAAPYSCACVARRCQCK